MRKSKKISQTNVKVDNVNKSFCKVLLFQNHLLKRKINLKGTLGTFLSKCGTECVNLCIRLFHTNKAKSQKVRANPSFHTNRGNLLVISSIDEEVMYFQVKKRKRKKRGVGRHYLLFLLLPSKLTRRKISIHV